MSGRWILLRYALFAAWATLANLAAQRAVLAVVPGETGFALAVLTGTAAGLVFKYLLDKRWIFEDRGTGLAHHGRTFSLYTVMGVATTLLFWAVETAFWLIWKTHAMRELGAVIGLGIGYTVKYHLDRAFVFRAARAGQG